MASAATSDVLSRPTLEARLDEAFGKRLTLLVAGAGYGKSTLLRQWTEDLAAIWYAAMPRDRVLSAFASGLAEAYRARLETLELGAAFPSGEQDSAPAETIAAAIARALESALTHDLVLVVDDAHELQSSPHSLRLVESLCRHAPATLHVVLASREPLPLRVERLMGQGAVLELGGTDLAFSVPEVVALTATLGDDGAVAEALHDVTRGWPAAVRLGIEAVRRLDAEERAPAIAALGESGSPLFAYLAQEVFGREPPELQDLIRHVAAFHRFSPTLCAAVGLEDAAGALEGMTQRGLFVSEHRGWWTLHALVREFALSVWPLRPEERRALLVTAAAWFESNCLYEDALRAYQSAGESADVQHLLVREGRTLIGRGAGDAVVDAARTLPPELSAASWSYWCATHCSSARTWREHWARTSGRRATATRWNPASPGDSREPGIWRATSSAHTTST